MLAPIEETHTTQPLHRNLSRWRSALSCQDRQALDRLLAGIGEAPAQVLLGEAPTAREAALLAILLELAKRLDRLEGHTWVHPPFP